MIPRDWRSHFRDLRLTPTQWAQAEREVRNGEGPYYEYVMRDTDYLAPWQIDKLRAIREQFKRETDD